MPTHGTNYAADGEMWIQILQDIVIRIVEVMYGMEADADRIVEVIYGMEADAEIQEIVLMRDIVQVMYGQTNAVLVCNYAVGFVKRNVAFQITEAAAGLAEMV